MLDHVFTDAISALRDALREVHLERQAFEEHFQMDVLTGDVTWETSYGLPGEGLPPRIEAHITFDWPTWSQTTYRRWYVDEELEEAPVIELEIVLRIQRLASAPDAEMVMKVLPRQGPSIGNEALERGGATLETAYGDTLDEVAYALEVAYEGIYELAEEVLADGSNEILDQHFGALAGWISSILVRLGDLKLEYLPPEEEAIDE
ncbi:MAG: hypothetical protein AB7L13_18840 [Acidimicrobiia bacterium]